MSENSKILRHFILFLLFFLSDMVLTAKESFVEKALQSAIDVVKEEDIDSFRPIVCENVVSVLKTDKCRLLGGRQMCESYGLTELFSGSKQSERLKEETSKQLQESVRNVYLTQLKDLKKLIKAAGKEKDEQFKHIYDESNIKEKLLSAVTQNVSYRSVSRISTSCNNILFGENVRLLSQVSCEMGGDWIRFAKQSTTVSGLSRCAVNTDAPLDLMGDEYMEGVDFLDAYQDFGSEWVPKGVDPVVSLFWVYFTLMFVVVVGGPVIAISGHGDGKTNIMRVVVFSFSLTLAFFSYYVWPGDYALKNGMWPYTYPYTMKPINPEKGPICPLDSTPPVSIAVKPYGIMEKGSDGKYDLHGYGKECGILSGKCDNVQSKIDLDAWNDIQKACYNAPVGIVKTCAMKDVFESVVTMTDLIPGCKRCEGKIGLYDDTVSCEATPEINPRVYAGFGYSFGLDNRRSEVECPEGDYTCIPNPQDYARISPGECTDQNYQFQKRKAIKMLKACEDVTAFSRADSENLIDMCPPNVSDYLSKCGPDGKCTYETSNKKLQPFCENNLEGCDSNNYIADSYFDKALVSTCKMRTEAHEQKKDLFYVVVLPVFIFLVIGLCSCYMVVASDRKKFLYVPLPVYLIGMALVIPMLIPIESTSGIYSAYTRQGDYVDGVIPEDGEESHFETREYYFWQFMAMAFALTFLVAFLNVTALVAPPYEPSTTTPKKSKGKVNATSK